MISGMMSTLLETGEYGQTRKRKAEAMETDDAVGRTTLMLSRRCRYCCCCFCFCFCCCFYCCCSLRYLSPS